MIVSKRVSFCYGHRLLNHKGRCQFVHGHNGEVEILLRKHSLNDLGMVIDFSLVKNVIGKWIDDNWDHSFMLNTSDPMAVEIVGVMEKHCAAGRVFRFDSCNPTAENMVRYLERCAGNGTFSDVVSGSPYEGICQAKFKVFETPTSYAESDEWVTIQ
jgi:6-pyruvoyltetrahydropterin/6-carboxytetrahydropterin synthase